MSNDFKYYFGFVVEEIFEFGHTIKSRCFDIMWFQKISIPLPWRELEIPEGWGWGVSNTQEIPEGRGWTVNLVFRRPSIQYGIKYQSS